jgi:hypothetical protein
MIRIAEKLGFIRVRAVAVCAKVGISRKVGHKKACIPANLRQNCLGTKFLTVRSDFGKIIDVGRAKLCFLDD